jgi:hypothetical protein
MFGKKLPLEVHETFLYLIFKTAENRGMKAMIAEADGKTARLFARYGFKIWSNLPSIQSKEKEFLIYVERGTPEWEMAMDRFHPKLPPVKIEKLEPK